MHPVWRDHLTATSTRIDANGIPRFPEPAPGASLDCRLFDLSQFGLLAVRGEDAVGFLQGQLSNDVRELSESHVQWSSHCSQKGRMLATFLVMRVDDTFYLQLPAERIPDLLKRLRMFVLRSRVSVEDASDDLVRIAIAGDCAVAAVGACGLPAPDSENGLAVAAGIAVVRLPGPTPRIEIIGPPEPLLAHWGTLRAHAAPANTDAWTLLDIRAGIPSVYNATADTFVPQMVNMQLIDGVSFHKGCYTGQEIVARMQYLGKLKRRMYIGEVESETPPQPGDALFSPDSTSQQGSGTVVAASPIDTGRYALLAVAEIQAAESGEVRLSEGGPLLRLKAPPYGFPVEE
ncbi:MULTISPECIES: folate-binding protein YgfZ [unclassified Thiocapsa]|uniref:CAF17-like 4Fe-4S cluster assembly/insertion protein YgfZ n=1 Tax=unclassified Thiocapsa TaxID=2641286 RepID=UPI0035AF4BCB